MSQTRQKLARKSSITSLRNQRSPCKCQWCAKPALQFGRLKKHDLPITLRRRYDSGHGISRLITPRTRIPRELPLIGSPRGSVCTSKQSASTDSDVQEPQVEEDLTICARKLEQAQIGERFLKWIATPMNDRGSSSSRESLSRSDNGSPPNTEVDACHNYFSKEVSGEGCPQRQGFRHRAEYGNLADSEDLSSYENVEDSEDSSSSSNAGNAEADEDSESEGDREVRKIIFRGVRARVLGRGDSRKHQRSESEDGGSLDGYTSTESLVGSNPSHDLKDLSSLDSMESSADELSSSRSERSSSNSEAFDLDSLSDSEMPSEKESKMNLSALKQVDPEINEIVDSAAQVALYQYSTQTGQWAKTEVEGALYVYAHRNAHQRGLIILNRNSPKNYKEPIRADIEFKIKTPFLIYKTTAGHIFGAWFYVEEECTRVGNLCCRLVSYLKKRGRNESGSQADNNNQQQGISILQNLLPPSALPKVDAQSGANIMSLLKKAEGGSAQVSNGNSNGSSSSSSNNHNINHHHHNGNITQHHQNGKSKKQPLTPNNSNHNDSGSRQQENGRHRKATGDSTPGVPVVHKPVPTKSLPSSVEQLFKSAANPQQQQQKKQQQQQQQQGSSSSSVAAANKHYSPMPESTTPKTPRGAQNGGGGGDLERLLGDLSRSSLESPPPSVALVETKVEALTPLNPCMASILSKLNESAQKVQREAEMARNSPTTEEALLRAFKGPLPNNIGLEKKLTLITPEMLEESLSQGPSTPPQTLSRYELKSALLHLLDTDDDFLTKIHNAYVQGVSRRKL